MASRVVIDNGKEPGSAGSTERQIELRDQFRHFSGKIYLPVFAVQSQKGWRPLRYEMDLVSQIDWSLSDWSFINDLQLVDTEDKDVEMVVSLGNPELDLVKPKQYFHLKVGGLALDYSFATRHMLDVIANPWIAYDICKNVFDSLIKRYNRKLVSNNFVFILEELYKHALSEKNRLSEQVFRGLIKKKRIRFIMFRDSRGYRLPSSIPVRSTSRTLTRSDGLPLQRSLFDFVPEESFDGLERDVAWCLEDQGKLLWWYRAIARQDYSIQGWKKDKIYPDFVFTQTDEEDSSEYATVFVIETKGLFLKNEDTGYKQQIFDLCNQLGEEKSSDRHQTRVPR